MAANAVNNIGNSIFSIVTQRQAMLYGLDAFVKTHPIDALRDRYFNQYGAGLKANDPVIWAIQHIPAAGLIIVYPLEGNFVKTKPYNGWVSSYLGLLPNCSHQ